MTTSSNQAQLAVSYKLLLSLYAIIPLCLALQLLDSFALNGVLLSYLPSSPSHFLLFQVIFGTPHILASTILLASNREYVHFYHKKILLMTLAIILFFAVANQTLSYLTLYLLVTSWTVYHVLKQQHGVGRGAYSLPTWAFYLLLWLSISAGLSIYIGIFLKNTLSIEQAEWVKVLASSLVFGLFLATLFCQRYMKSTFSAVFMWANSALIFASFYLYMANYSFLAILIPRLVHDATAYIFYITHDVNKHKKQAQNSIYRWAKKIKLNIFLVLPLLSFLLTYLLQVYGDQSVNFISQFFFGTEIKKAITLGFIGYCSLMHYYTEAFTWKYGSPYRQYIRFKP
ncbi:MAG: hypothetical protein PSN04_03260 [Methyloprofundus sp.]|nr:hypothetical protein [Methyloprofundus sp.]